MDHLKWAVVVALSCSSKVPGILKNKHIHTHTSSNGVDGINASGTAHASNLMAEGTLADVLQSRPSRTSCSINLTPSQIFALENPLSLSTHAAWVLYLWKFHDLVSLLSASNMMRTKTVLQINDSRNSKHIIDHHC